MPTHAKGPAEKTNYSSPELTVFGSVRNLTGGSTGTNNDGAGGQDVMGGMV